MTAEEAKQLAPPAESTLAPMSLETGILPKNTQDLVRLAQLYATSGLAPKTLDTWQKIAVAMAMCIETGRPIMTGIQDMAVINGKVGIYGDAALAEVRASGLLEKFKEWETGTPYQDGWTFYCLVKRKGSEEATGIWGWSDAKRAGFDSPRQRDGSPDRFSPWTRFTRRMMQFKARNFVLRDQFGDVLKGLKIAEDLHDAIDLEDTGNGSYEPIKEKTEGKAEALKDRIREQQKTTNDVAKKDDEDTNTAEPTEQQPDADSAQDTPQSEPGPKDETEGGKYRLWPVLKALRTQYPSEIWKLIKSGRLEKEATEADLVELKNKWERQVKDAPWPLEKQNADGNDDLNAVLCPIRDDRPVPVKNCTGCPNAAVCGPYEEWRYNNEPVKDEKF